MPEPLTIGVLLGAYLIGGVPFGVLLARLVAGRDVRRAGSGNIGATNVARVAGKKLGALTLLLDAGKGAAAVGAAGVIVRPGPSYEWIVAAAGFAAIVGHCFSPYLRLKGGKGVATSFGVFLALAPLAALVGFAAWALVYGATRISSAGSLAAAAAVPAVVWWTGDRIAFYLSLSTVGLVLVRHHANIRRLITGREERV